MFEYNALFVLSRLLSVTAQYTATYSPDSLPDHTEEGQAGTNQCGTASSRDSKCQNVYVNSIDDFCLWAPPEPGANSEIGETEGIEVSWCMQSGYGTRLIPDGSIKGAHVVITPDYIQITGTGNFANMNIPDVDEGGELDPHGATGNGNPVGGLVFSDAFGELKQIHEWTNFISSGEYCFRACNPSGPNAAELCQHIYDVMGCRWNMPANYDEGVFEQCEGDSAEPMGVYGTVTFHQGEGLTPPAHPAPSSSKCVTHHTIKNQQKASPTTSGAPAHNTRYTVEDHRIRPGSSTNTLVRSTEKLAKAAGSHSSSGSSPTSFFTWQRLALTFLALIVGPSVVGALIIH